MSEASKTTQRRTRAKKATTGSTKPSVETDTSKPTAQGESEQALADKAKAEAEAKAKQEAEEKAKAEAQAKKELEAQKKKEAEEKKKKESQQNDQVDSKETGDSDAEPDVDVLGVMGALKVCSKSEAGFWRSGVKFHKQQETLVLVVDKEIKEPAPVDAKDFPDDFVVFMVKEKAQRVFDEPSLTVEPVELEDVIDIEDSAEL